MHPAVPARASAWPPQHRRDCSSPATETARAAHAVRTAIETRHGAPLGQIAGCDPVRCRPPPPTGLLVGESVDDQHPGLAKLDAIAGFDFPFRAQRAQSDDSTSTRPDRRSVLARIAEDRTISFSKELAMLSRCFAVFMPQSQIAILPASDRRRRFRCLQFSARVGPLNHFQVQHTLTLACRVRCRRRLAPYTSPWKGPCANCRTGVHCNTKVPTGCHFTPNVGPAQALSGRLPTRHTACENPHESSLPRLLSAAVGRWATISLRALRCRINCAVS